MRTAMRDRRLASLVAALAAATVLGACTPVSNTRNTPANGTPGVQSVPNPNAPGADARNAVNAINQETGGAESGQGSGN